MRRFLALLAIAAGPYASAEPAVKVLNFTAEWCPNCQILNPRLSEAMDTLSDDQVQRVDLDMTSARGARRPAVMAVIESDTRAHQAGYLWDWYGGATGLAAVISSDNGELLTCLLPANSVQDMQARLTQAILAQRGTPGDRMPDETDCPTAFK
ncbi:MAG: thioredoxin family protein [Pseudomonadota bacterium]